MLPHSRSDFCANLHNDVKPYSGTIPVRYGSWKIAQGEDILYVSAQMGHADAAITLKIYSHLLQKDRPEAAPKTDEFIFGVKVKRD
jgi:hypothetical protein